MPDSKPDKITVVTSFTKTMLDSLDDMKRCLHNLCENCGAYGDGHEIAALSDAMLKIASFLNEI